MPWRSAWLPVAPRNRCAARWSSQVISESADGRRPGSSYAVGSARRIDGEGGTAEPYLSRAGCRRCASSVGQDRYAVVRVKVVCGDDLQQVGQGGQVQETRPYRPRVVVGQLA